MGFITQTHWTSCCDFPLKSTWAHASICTNTPLHLQLQICARSGWLKECKETCPIKPIRANATMKMENSLACGTAYKSWLFTNVVLWGQKINQTALGWQCFMNWICIAVMHCSRWQHNSIIRSHIFCIFKAWFSILLFLERLRIYLVQPLTTLSCFNSHSLLGFLSASPSAFLPPSTPNVALIWASACWITLQITDWDLNFQLFSCTLAHSTTPHSHLSLLFFFFPA